MDLNFTAEELAFRASIRDWVAQHLPQDISHKVHNALRLSREDHQRWARILGAKGWLGWNWPKAFGGPGWNAVERHLFEEELALAGAPRVVPFGPVMVAPVIMAFGSPEQQQRFLPGMINGTERWCQGFSEPGAGSDLASLTTTATRDGDDYIINGRKWWTSGANDPRCEILIVMGRTNPDAASHQQQSMILVPIDTPGVTLVRSTSVFGWQDQHGHAEVIYDNVRVPASNLLAEEGMGFAIAQARLGPGRIHHCMRAIGVAERALARASATTSRGPGCTAGSARCGSSTVPTRCTCAASPGPNWAVSQALSPRRRSGDERTATVRRLELPGHRREHGIASRPVLPIQ